MGASGRLGLGIERAQVEGRLLLDRSQNDVGPGARHPFDGADLVGDELPERVGVPRSDLQDVGVLARYVMALKDVGHIPDGFDEPIGVPGLGEHHADEGRRISMDQLGVEERHVPLDVAPLGQLLNPLGNGGS